MEWQPIETVPKGAKWFLLCGGEVDEDDWEGNKKPPCVVARRYNNFGYRWWVYASYDSAVCTCEYKNPTHWMPLPPLPNASQPVPQPLPNNAGTDAQTILSE
jgi:hypothetical protein